MKNKLEEIKSLPIQTHAKNPYGFSEWAGTRTFIIRDCDFVDYHHLQEIERILEAKSIYIDSSEYCDRTYLDIRVFTDYVFTDAEIELMELSDE